MQERIVILSWYLVYGMKFPFEIPSRLTCKKQAKRLFKHLREHSACEIIFQLFTPSLIFKTFLSLSVPNVSNTIPLGAPHRQPVRSHCFYFLLPPPLSPCASGHLNPRCFYFYHATTYQIIPQLDNPEMGKTEGEDRRQKEESDATINLADRKRGEDRGKQQDKSLLYKFIRRQLDSQTS